MHRFVGLAVFLAGCGLSLDLSPEDPPRGDGAVSVDGGFDSGARDGATEDGATEDGATDGGVDAVVLPDAGPCREDSDCSGRPRTGAPTECAAWACVEGFCVENDYDGDGVGPGCEDPRDCDDFDRTIGLDGTVACPAELSQPGICGATAYRQCTDGALADSCEGFSERIDTETCNGLDDDCDGSTDEDVPSETFGVGRCAESLTCVDGAWRAVAPGAEPTDTCEAGRFGVDDDCDGVVDENCAPSMGDCVFVRTAAPGGEPADPTDPRTPYGTMGDALAYAESAGLARICLLAGNGAGARECSTTTFTMPRTEVAHDVTILGGLRADAAGTVTRCATGAEATRLAPLGTAGIAVPSGVTLTLRDLVVPHPIVGGATQATALDVRGGGALVMSNVRVRGGDSAGVASTRRGVRVQAGGSLSASACRIEAGPGSTGYAIDAVGGDVALLAGCVGADCAPTCGDLNRGVFGGRPGAGVRISGGTLMADRTAFCGASSRAGVEVLSTARVTLARSLVELGPTVPATFDGVSVADCDAFWMHRSRVRLSASGVDERTYQVAGVDIAGGCPALLTDNVVEGLRGVGEPNVGNALGVRCVGSPCAIVGNEIAASVDADPDKAIAVSCEAGCALVASENVLVGSTADAGESIGLSLDAASGVVSRSRFVGGCGNTTLGALLRASRTRLTNNEGVGAMCANPPSFAAGLAVEGSPIVSNGNSYDGGRGGAASAECNSAGLAFASEVRSGELRNDVFVAGDCRFARGVVVQDARPLTFTHSGIVGTYYEVLDDREVTDAATLLTLAPLYVGHVFTSAPGFVDRATSLRITAGSPFVGAGTRIGAPLVDFAGRPRPRPPSIGAWEP